MSHTAWIEYNEVEITNDARTAALAEAMRLGNVWLDSSGTEWVRTALSGSGYEDITNAPWYDAGYVGSSEFAGVIVTDVAGLDDSSFVSDAVEYVTDGGHSGKPRNTTQALVFSALLVAKTDRGAEFGLRWLNRTLRENGRQVFCSGADLRYFRFESAASPIAHRRDVRLSRGTSVTRKRADHLGAVWTVTWTMTAADPYEYGEAVEVLNTLGGSPSSSYLLSSGTVGMTQSSCPVYDYTPIYDPSYPALVASPTVPDLLPDGWNISPGMGFTRYWARIAAPEPSGLVSVPTFLLSCTTQARRVRVSVWPAISPNNDQCDPLFVAVVGYLPPNTDFYIDGEQKACYAWDGVSPVVRRTDSLVYNSDASPVRWTSFTDDTELLVTLDIFSGEGAGTVRADLILTPKSD